MIKKLSLLLVLCSMYIVRADQISDAIRYSDAQRVSELLSRTVLTEKQLNKYLDIAEHTIQTRRDQLKDDVMQTNYRSSKATGRSVCVMFACLASGIGAAIMSDLSFWCSEKEMYDKIVIASVVGFFVSGLVFTGCLFGDRASAYSNALRVKELLHDYEVPATVE